MPTAAAAEALDRIHRTNARLDRILDARADAADSAAEQERRDTMRRHADRCADRRLRYDAAFEPFGKRAPEPMADSFPPDYRRDLFKTAQNYLPSDHPLSGVDPHEEIGASAMPVMEAQLFEALREQAARPTGDNRADSVNDPRARRVHIDPDTGAKEIHYVARKSFIADYAAPVRRVLRIQDPNSGRVLFGPAYPTMPGR
jgi:hypothetical protein